MSSDSLKTPVQKLKILVDPLKYLRLAPVLSDYDENAKVPRICGNSGIRGALELRSEELGHLTALESSICTVAIRKVQSFLQR